MIKTRLTTAETAARLGVKAATVYAYVSRGLLHPERGPQGSTFDRHEVTELARTARRPVPATTARRRVRPAGTEGGGGADGAEGRPAGSTAPTPGDPLFLTELTLIADGGLYYRGRNAVGLSRMWSFEQAAEWLWTGRAGSGGPWPGFQDRDGRLGRALADLGPQVPPVERFALAAVTAGLGDALRHDIDPGRVPATGRSLLMALVASLPRPRPGGAGDGGTAEGPTGPVAELVWRGLSRDEPTAAAVAAVDAALVLAADHELAPSTLAVRVAASFRADPYAVVLTGLGPSGGSWPPGSTGAPGEVEGLLRRAASVGPEQAIGEHLRRSGQLPHGFGMPLYPAGDPRGAELLARLGTAGRPERRQVVAGVLEVGRQRGFPPPNFDMAVGALAFCGDMVPGAGQAVFTLGKVAGWLAHAMEEYAAPTRFRSRADYVGVAPEVGAASGETPSS